MFNEKKSQKLNKINKITVDVVTVVSGTIVVKKRYYSIILNYV